VLFGRKKSAWDNEESEQDSSRLAQLYVAKNRFGPPQQNISYHMDYVGLTPLVSPREYVRFMTDFGAPPDFLLDHYEEELPDEVLNWVDEHEG